MFSTPASAYWSSSSLTWSWVCPMQVRCAIDREVVLPVHVDDQLGGQVPGAAPGAVGHGHEAGVAGARARRRPASGSRHRRRSSAGRTRRRSSGPTARRSEIFAMGVRGYRSPAGPRSAASTVLTKSMARVMGPTPPMRGDSQPATSATSSATSDTSFLPSKLTPGGDHRRAGLDHVGGDHRRRPGRGHQDVGLAGQGPDVRHARVYDGDGRVGVGPLERQQVGQRAGRWSDPDPRSPRGGR